MASNRAENRKFHFTYKVTCSYNGRVFYGLHSADELDDTFSGKGYSLSHSIRDYGLEAHKLERIKIYESRTEAKIAYNELKAMELVIPRRPEDRKFHFVYKTTRFDGKYYIGVHSTDDLEDGYMGSGTYIGRSLKKHGRDKHVTEILQHCASRDGAFDLECRLVTEQALQEPLCMNTIKGGRQHGGRVYGVTEETRQKISDSMKAHHQSEAGLQTKQRLSEYHTGKKRPPEVGTKISARFKGQIRPALPEEHRKNISKALVGKAKPPSTVEKMKAACTGRRKITRTDGTWYWGRVDDPK